MQKTISEPLAALPRPVAAVLIVGTSVGGVLVLSTGPASRPLPPAAPHRRVGAIAWRATVLQVHHQIEGDLHSVSEHIPTVVLPTGIDRWPAPWDFGHSQRLISTATAAAERFLTELRVDGPGLYRADADDRPSRTRVETGTSP